MTTLPGHPSMSHRPRAFSLIEVLLAIFILGIGVISIAALFPAGIAQQRASVDEIIGPTVASNALSILRSKIKPEDFGTFEQFGVAAPRVTTRGDFNWLRPGFIFVDDPATPNQDERGAINIFSAGAWGATEFAGGYAGSSPSLVGIPYNTSLFASAPRMLISQTERYYPAVTQAGSGDIAKPQFVWDCMFRRFQGRILVAIFVYRVNQPGGGATQYITPQANGSIPPLPIWLDLTLPVTLANSCSNGPWHPGGIDRDVFTEADNRLVLGVPGGVVYNPDDQSQCWQEPRQWLLDQNNNIHRVLGTVREDDDPANPMEVELVRAAPGMPSLGVFYTDATTGNAVSDIWFIPLALPDVNGDLLTLTPVYATVREL